MEGQGRSKVTPLLEGELWVTKQMEGTAGGARIGRALRRGRGDVTKNSPRISAQGVHKKLKKSCLSEDANK